MEVGCPGCPQETSPDRTSKPRRGSGPACPLCTCGGHTHGLPQPFLLPGFLLALRAPHYPRLPGSLAVACPSRQSRDQGRAGSRVSRPHRLSVRLRRRHGGGESVGRGRAGRAGRAVRTLAPAAGSGEAAGSRVLGAQVASPPLPLHTEGHGCPPGGRGPVSRGLCWVLGPSWRGHVPAPASLGPWPPSPFLSGQRWGPGGRRP